MPSFPPLPLVRGPTPPLGPTCQLVFVAVHVDDSIAGVDPPGSNQQWNVENHPLLAGCPRLGNLVSNCPADGRVQDRFQDPQSFLADGVLCEDESSDAPAI